MTKSSKYQEADSSSRDFGIPDRLPTKEMWTRFPGKWETLSQEEREGEIIKLDEMEIDVYNPLK